MGLAAAALYRLHNFNSGVQSTNKKEVSVGKVGVVVASWRHYCRRVSKRIYRVGPTRLTAPINLVDSIYLQLATRSEHFCRSSGYSFKFIGHASVSDTLQERNETSLGIDRHISKEDSILLCTSICILYCVPDTIEHVAVREDTNVDIWN